VTNWISISFWGIIDKETETLMQPAVDHLPNGVEATVLVNSCIQPSAHLSKLLADSRSRYDWPAGTGAAKSQSAIISLEKRVANLLESLDESRAHEIRSGCNKTKRWDKSRRFFSTLNPVFTSCSS
jgi:hypothetical protein